MSFVVYCNITLLYYTGVWISANWSGIS